MKECPHCGQTIPDSDPPPVHLTPTQRKIFDRVRKAGKHGVMAERLFDHLYGDRPDGGPVSGLRGLAVLISQANFRLRQIHKGIRKAEQGGPYVLVDWIRPRGRRYLHEQDVLAIRSARHMTQLQLAEQFGVSQGTISMIRANKTHMVG